ncbi:MAG: hypothetical protein ABEH78_06130 [Haloferacaceae archaeon]
MRPNCRKYESNIYECQGCGARNEAPETRTCGKCGAELVNISRSRDL